MNPKNVVKKANDVKMCRKTEFEMPRLQQTVTNCEEQGERVPNVKKLSKDILGLKSIL